MTASLPLLLTAKPVYIDSILTKSNSFKLDVEIADVNIQKSEGVSSSYTLQTQSGDFVSIQNYFTYNITPYPTIGTDTLNLLLAHYRPLFFIYL